MKQFYDTYSLKLLNFKAHNRQNKPTHMNLHTQHTNTKDVTPTAIMSLEMNKKKVCYHNLESIDFNIKYVHIPLINMHLRIGKKNMHFKRKSAYI